jgi:hypothetical protein
MAVQLKIVEDQSAVWLISRIERQAQLLRIPSSRWSNRWHIPVTGKYRRSILDLD